MYEISWLACKGVGYSKILIPKDNVGVKIKAKDF